MFSLIAWNEVLDEGRKVLRAALVGDERLRVRAGKTFIYNVAKERRVVLLPLLLRALDHEFEPPTCWDDD